MSDDDRNAPADAPLNPALRRTTETVYDTERTTPAPVETASAKEGEGEGWPIIWLVIVVACVAISLYLLF